MLPEELFIGGRTDDRFYTPTELESFQRDRERKARVPRTSLEDIGRMVPTPASLMSPGIERRELLGRQESVNEMRRRRLADEESMMLGEAAGPLGRAGANIFGGLMDGAGMAARGVMGAIPTELPAMASPQARVEVVGGGQDYKALRDQRMGQTESELSGIRMRDNLVRARRELAQRNQNPDTTPLSNEAVQNLAVEDKQRKAAERLMQDAERAQYMERLLPPQTQVYLADKRQREQAEMFIRAREAQANEAKAISQAEATAALTGQRLAKTNQIEQMTPEQIQMMRDRRGLLVEQTGLTAAKTRTEEVRPELMQAAQALKERQFEEQKVMNSAARKLSEAKTEKERASAQKMLREAEGRVAQTRAIQQKLEAPFDPRYMTDPEYKEAAFAKQQAARVLGNPNAKADRRAQAEAMLQAADSTMERVRERSRRVVFDPNTGALRPAVMGEAMAPVAPQSGAMPMASGNPMLDTINALPMGYEELAETNRAFGVN